MKYIVGMFTSLTLLFVIVFWILFTQSGNNIVKPYMEDFIAKKLQKDVSIEAYTLKTNFLDLEVVIDKTSKIILNGNLDLLRQQFDLDYIVDSLKLETPYFNLNDALHVKGDIVGNIPSFSVTGTGNALRSNISFDVSLKDEKITDIKLDTKNVKIEDILTLLKKPIYTRGMFDAKIDVKSIENNQYIGKSNILIHFGTIDKNLIAKEFGLFFPSVITYQGKINADIDGDTIYATSEIFSNLAKIETKKTKYDINKMSLYSDYTIFASNLALLEKIANHPLDGSFLIEGNIQKDKNDFALDMNSKSLGGNIKAILFNNTLKVDMGKIELSKLLKMLKLQNYTEGKMSVNLDMPDITEKNRKGEVVLSIDDAKLFLSEIEEIESSNVINYQLKSSSDINKQIIVSKADLLSDVLTLNINDNKFEIQSQSINGNYALHVKDLNQLAFLTKRPLKGDLSVDGIYKYKTEKLYVDGKSDFLNAKSKFILENNLLNFQSDELSILKVTDLLQYPSVFDSYANLVGEYNLLKEKGNVTLNALNGKLLQSELTNLVLLVGKYDLTEEIYKDSLFTANIDKNQIDFTLLMNGLESYFKIPKGFIDTQTNVIDSDFDILIGKKDFKGSINGSLDKPEVSLDSSVYIKEKLDKAIDKNLPEEWKEPAKELLKLFG